VDRGVNGRPAERAIPVVLDHDRGMHRRAVGFVGHTTDRGTMCRGIRSIHAGLYTATDRDVWVFPRIATEG
jgi:hypothetical protein